MQSIAQPIISVGRLLDQLNSQLMFTRKYVYLLFKKTKQQVRIGIRDKNGLYTTYASETELNRRTTAHANLSVQAHVIREKSTHCTVAWVTQAKNA